MTIDDCCGDDSCSSLDAVGCTIMSHEEVEKGIAEITITFRDRYFHAIGKVNNSRLYDILKRLWIPDYI